MKDFVILILRDGLCQGPCGLTLSFWWNLEGMLEKIKDALLMCN